VIRSRLVAPARPAKASERRRKLPSGGGLVAPARPAKASERRRKLPSVGGSIPAEAEVSTKADLSRRSLDEGGDEGGPTKHSLFVRFRPFRTARRGFDRRTSSLRAATHRSPSPLIGRLAAPTCRAEASERRRKLPSEGRDEGGRNNLNHKDSEDEAAAHLFSFSRRVRDEASGLDLNQTATVFLEPV
jgi:hypothetical protein